MTLRLSLAKHPPLVEGCPTSVSLDGKARFVIGRDEQADWTLADTSKAISALHCEILFDGTTYMLRDLSTNGTYLNGAAERLDGAHPIRDGDSMAVGLYVIRASLTTQAVTGSTPRVDKPADDIWMQAVPRSQSAPRGGDPAAMMTPDSGGWPLPEEAHGAADAPIGFADMTMIFPAPKRQSKAPSEKGPSDQKGLQDQKGFHDPRGSLVGEAPVPVAPSPTLQPAGSAPPVLAEVPPPPSRPAQAPPTTDGSHHLPEGSGVSIADPQAALRRLAAALGIGVEAFAGEDPDALVERLAVVARRLVVGVKELLDERTRAQRNLGSRHFAIPRGQARNPLKFSAHVEDALLLLLRPGAIDADAAMAQSFAELRSHQQAVLAAAQAAATLLGGDLAPSAFAAPGAAMTTEQKARLWDQYGALWQGLETDWAAGFVEAFKLHMASTYDQHEA